MKKWKASPYYRGTLSSFYHVNPKTLLPEFENEDEVSFIPMEAVDDKDGRIYLQESTFGQVRKGYTVFKENDLLWAKITPCMQNGKSSVAYGLKNGVGFGSTEFHVLRAKDKNVSIEFLWNILRLDSFLKAAQGAFGGSAGQQRVPATFISNLPIPLPPLPIQEKLVEEMERARESRRRKLLEAERLLSTLDGWLLETLGITPPPEDNRKVFAVRLKAMNSERIDALYYLPTFIKAAEELKKLSHKVAPLKSQLEFAPLNGLDSRNYVETGQRYLRVQNVRPYQIDASDAKYVETNTTKDINLQVGDVLLTRKGTYGVAAPVTSEYVNDLISSEVILLRLAEHADISTDYLVYWLNSSLAQLMFRRLKTGGVMGHITQDIVNDFPIPIVDKAIQEKIVDKFNVVREESRRLKSEAESEWQAAKDWFEAHLLGE